MSIHTSHLKFSKLRVSLVCSRGFTLMEMMIVIAIMAISLGLTAPSIRAVTAHNQVAAVNNSILTGLNLARSEAVSRGGSVVICPSQNGNRCNAGQWNTGWIVFDDADGNGSMVAGEVIRRSFRESDVSSAGLSGNVAFQADGTTTLGASTSITICFPESDLAAACRRIQINRFGSLSSKELSG